jgi:predicted nucleic acid-binding protein
MDKVRVVVTDANILINLIHIGQLPLLGALVGFDFVAPDEVVAEILDPEQAGALQEALQAGFVAFVSIADTEELAIFTALTTSLGKGESACLALAQRRGWMIASDEGGAFRREANQRLGTGRLINTSGLLLIAIRAGVLTVEEADQAKAVLEARRFRIKFNSFRDMLDG